MSEQAGQQAVQIQIKDEKAQIVYSNFARIGGTPEELFIDFGINLQTQDTNSAPSAEINTRVLLNFYSAKRLALMLSQAVQRYEQQFGPLELDPRRRLKQPN